MSQPFDLSSTYYDLLYRGKDTIAEVDYVDQLLQRHGVGGCDLLDFGSGTGRHGVLLGSRGYRVHGLEKSSSMVSLAKESECFSCQQGDITSTQLSQHFNAVTSLFHVVSYLTSNSDVQAVFANAAYHLYSGGLFLFDVWYSPAVMFQRPEVRVKRLQNENLSITRIAEPTVISNSNCVNVHYTIIAQDLQTKAFNLLEENHLMRHFSLPEIDLFADMTGFERVAFEEWLTGDEPSESTWGVCFVFRKK